MTRLTGFSPLVRKQIKERAGVDDDADWVRCEGCSKWWEAQSIECHHRRPRGSGGSRRPDTNLAANGMCLCHECHTWAESQRDAAYDKGWLISQHRKGITPCEIPVEMYDGTYLLDNEGHRYSIPNPHREAS